MLRVYVIGDLRGAYRNKYLVDILERDPDIALSGSYVKGKLKKALSVFRMLRSDLVVISACNHNSVFAKVAYLARKKILTDFYISFFDTDVLDRKLYDKKSKEARKMYKIDRKALVRSKEVLFLNMAEGTYYTGLFGMSVPQVNGKAVPLCIPEKMPAFLPYYNGKTDYIRFCWTGTYIPLQGLDRVLKAVKIATDKGLNMRLTVWGDKEEKAAPFIEMAKQLKIEEYVDFINVWGDLDRWEKYICENCDVTMGIFGPSKKAKVVLANKVVDGVAYRTPVITGKSGGVDEFFTDEILVCDNDPASIAEKMIEAASMKREDVEALIEKAYAIYSKNFTPDRFAERILESVKGVGCPNAKERC